MDEYETIVKPQLLPPNCPQVTLREKGGEQRPLVWIAWILAILAVVGVVVVVISPSLEY